MNSTKMLYQSLEAAAATGIDIVPLFFERFFALHPAHRDSFNRPQATQGAMVNEMLELLIGLESGESWVLDTVSESVSKHQSYGDLDLEIFRNALEILKTTVEEIAADQWHQEFSTAWSKQIDNLMELIRSVF